MSTKIGHSIDLNLAAELKDPAFRKQFFLAEASAQIAAQIIALRKRRNKSQAQVAELIGTRQPAISRVEKADYRNWSFNTLRSIADTLDARIRILIEPYEDIASEYETPQEPYVANSPAVDAAKRRLESEQGGSEVSALPRWRDLNQIQLGLGDNKAGRVFQ